MPEKPHTPWMTPHRRTILIIIGSIIFAFLVFHLGMAFEGEQFRFAQRGPHSPPPMWGTMGPFGIPLPFPHDFIESGHGTVGTITSVSFPEIDITNRTGESKVVLMSSSTELHGEGTTTLQSGESIVVIGQSDTQGHVVAQFIRIFPPAPQPIQK